MTGPAARTSRVRATARRTIAALAAVTVAAAGVACSGGDPAPGGGDGAADGPPPASDEWSGEMTDVEMATEAYVAGYPLVVTVRTMQRLGGLLGVNELSWQRALSGPGNRTVVAPNRDTLYSVAVLDLRAEPMALSLPEVGDRYYTYQLLDAWTESFAYVGTRTTGGRAGTWVITPPGWDGLLPEGTDRIEAPTPQVFLLGRFLVDGDADVAAVTAISERTALRPLSALTGQAPPPPPPPLGDPAGSPQDVPAGAAFFDELGDALAVNPPTTPAQRALFERAAGLGIGPGRRPGHEATAEARAALDAGAAAGSARIGQAATRGAGEREGGWSTNLDVGTYGDDTLLRAVVAKVGWGANVPEEAVYPVARLDAAGEPLSGEHTYTIRFPAGGLPPVEAFWSLSVYGADMFFVAHPSDRYTIGDRTPGLVVADDGSLEITLSHRPPAEEPGHATNWLPVPESRFVLMLRLYLPGRAVLDGTYDLPEIERVGPAAPG